MYTGYDKFMNIVYGNEIDTVKVTRFQAWIS